MEQAIGAYTRVFGPEHPDTLTTMGYLSQVMAATNALAITLQDQGDLIAARDLLERVVEVSLRVLGPDHPLTLASQDDLAEVLVAIDRAVAESRGILPRRE